MVGIEDLVARVQSRLLADPQIYTAALTVLQTAGTPGWKVPTVEGVDVAARVEEAIAYILNFLGKAGYQPYVKRDTEFWESDSGSFLTGVWYNLYGADYVTPGQAKDLLGLRSVTDVAYYVQQDKLRAYPRPSFVDSVSADTRLRWYLRKGDVEKLVLQLKEKKRK